MLSKRASFSHSCWRAASSGLTSLTFLPLRFSRSLTCSAVKTPSSSLKVPTSVRVLLQSRAPPYSSFFSATATGTVETLSKDDDLQVSAGGRDRKESWSQVGSALGSAKTSRLVTCLRLFVERGVDEVVCENYFCCIIFKIVIDYNMD